MNIECRSSFARCEKYWLWWKCAVNCVKDDVKNDVRVGDVCVRLVELYPFLRHFLYRMDISEILMTLGVFCIISLVYSICVFLNN